MSIAETILGQLGGTKFVAMTGSKNFVGGKDFLSMKLAGNKLKTFSATSCRRCSQV